VRLLRASAVALVVLALLALATFALPVREWRTGELPAPALPLVAGGLAVEMPARIWIAPQSPVPTGLEAAARAPLR
jgi:hypothetical protein